jgi:hypothetical protein
MINNAKATGVITLSAHDNPARVKIAAQTRAERRKVRHDDNRNTLRITPTEQQRDYRAKNWQCNRETSRNPPRRRRKPLELLRLH